MEVTSSDEVGRLGETFNYMAHQLVILLDETRQKAVLEKELEIARTIQQNSQIIIMDEPNSALNANESERLFELMRDLRANGKSMIFISHFLEDVLAVADTVTVLRNGKKVTTMPASKLSKHAMFGAYEKVPFGLVMEFVRRISD